jgi:hypothetical protein
MIFKKKLYYCRECDKAYLKSRFERLACDYCHEECTIVDVPYPATTLLSWAILIACAVLFFIFKDISYYLFCGILITAVVAYFALAWIGVDRMKADAVEIGRNTTKPRAKKQKKHE